MTTLNIPITKAGATLEVNPDDFNEEIYKEIFTAGLKVLLNARQSNVKVKDLDGEALAKEQAAALAIANKNLEELRSGKIRKGRAAPTAVKTSGPVMTEARRLARDVIRNEIRAAGMRVADVEASDITKLANELIAKEPSYIAQAEANLAARANVANTDKESALAKLNALGGIAVSAKKVKAAEEAKAAKKSQLSAKQAGKAAPRKPKAEEAATAH